MDLKGSATSMDRLDALGVREQALRAALQVCKLAISAPGTAGGTVWALLRLGMLRRHG